MSAVWPTPNEVLAGVQYGPNGVDFVGTLSAVFASTFTVLIDEPVLHVGFPNKEIKPARQVAEVDVKPGKEIKRLFIETRPEDIVVTTSANTLTVVEVKV